MQRQLSETRAEVMESSNLDGRVGDGPGTLGDADWDDGVLGRKTWWAEYRTTPRNFDSLTCAAGELEAPHFENVSLTLRVTHG